MAQNSCSRVGVSPGPSSTPPRPPIGHASALPSDQLGSSTSHSSLGRAARRKVLLSSLGSSYLRLRFLPALAHPSSSSSALQIGPSRQAHSIHPQSNRSAQAQMASVFPTYYTRGQIKAKIAHGEVLVLHRGYVYKLNSWLSTHPGGALAILHFVGRDATDEIEAFHPEAVINQMRPFIIGKVAPESWDDKPGGLGWKPLNPPVQVGLWPRVLDDHLRQGSDSGYSSLQGSSDEEDCLVSDSTNLASGDCGASLCRKSSMTMVDRMRLLEPAEGPLCDHLDSRMYDLRPIRQKQISDSYRQLHDRIRSAGYYQAPQPLYGYGPDLLRYSILFAIFFVTCPVYPLLGSAFFLRQPALLSGSFLQYFISALFLGLWWHQVTFVAHDAGHSGVTGRWKFDRLLAIVFANLAGGISAGWWCDNHDVHHLVTNHPEHDPDIQHLPFFAISTKFFNSMKSTYYERVMKFDGLAKFMVAQQHRLYYLVMIFGRFNLLFLSVNYLWRRKQQKFRRLEILGIIGFWSWFGGIIYLLPTYQTRLMYVLISFAVTSPLHVQIVLSHFAQSTSDLGLTETFAQRQLRTTMDVKCPPYLDFLHGGLHMQVTHHLFPRIPRHHLRTVSEKFVQPWCQSQGLTYHSYQFVEGNAKVLGVLGEVARQMQVLGVVASAQAKGKID